MEFRVDGTAIMLAIAAVLWFFYLLPTWVRRREYLSTERNATRLQRTIRVMAETAELPEEVRVEATAREVARQERLVRQQRRRAEALARAELHEASARARLAETQAAGAARVARTVLRAPAPAAASRVAGFEGLRRARRLAGLLLLAAICVALVQFWLMATTGVVLGSWFVLAASLAAGVASVALQRRIVTRTRVLALRATPARRRSSGSLLDAETAVVPERSWTPVPVPKPLYLERQEPPRVPVVPALDAETLLRAAAAEAERALAEAHAEPEVVAFPRPAAPAAAPSRFAEMGRLGEVEAAMPDLDEVLRRRRSG